MFGWVLPFVFMPRLFIFIYSAISSIAVAYIRTESIPPCPLLSLIFLMLPCFVFTSALRLVFRSFITCHSTVFIDFIPLLFSTYKCSSESRHALSYALITSRNTMYMYAWFLLFSFDMVSFSINRLSVVALPFRPPVCASDMGICGLALLYIIISSIVPMLLEIVIPLSLDIFHCFPCLRTVVLLLPCAISL